MKDWLIKKTVPGLLNDRFLKPYGELTSFSFDSRERSAEGELMLKGEQDPIRVRVGNYEIISEGEKTFVVIHTFAASREWVSRLGQDFIVGKRFEIPASAGKYVAMIA